MDNTLTKENEMTTFTNEKLTKKTVSLLKNAYLGGCIKIGRKYATDKTTGSKMTLYQFAVIIAANEYADLRDRVTNPDGSFDKAGRWYPDNYQDCCSAIRSPSRAHPYSLMTHCRTAAHVAETWGVDPKDVKKVAKTIK